ncbi:MAG: hypothetical protein IJU37_00930 [Desulfovibrio sp.]|nr:hypothetical protein [Desulfovibrio sp.]
MRLPIHRWYRYSAGFSADWVRSVIRECKPSALLDPFVGSGTSLLAAEEEGIDSYGFEAHPFVARIARAKLSWNASVKELVSWTAKLLQQATSMSPDISGETPLLLKCYSTEALRKLCAIRESFLILKEEMSTSVGELLWLAITSILRPCSHAGTAQWQYVLPAKGKARVLEPYDAFKTKIDTMTADMRHFQRSATPSGTLMARDARERLEFLDGKIDLVVTSPPYPNNYDYGDSTRLEMCFWHEIRGWGDLQTTVRRFLVRSCSQHAAAEKLKLDDVLAAPQLEPIRRDLSEICRSLEEERSHHGGKKSYHTMVAAYFADIASVFHALRGACSAGSRMCFVIGDSAPYGVYVPVDEFMGRLALAVGFSGFSFEKIRDRNVKWKNRKHRVPLKEGRLWIEG